MRLTFISALALATIVTPSPVSAGSDPRIETLIQTLQKATTREATPEATLRRRGTLRLRVTFRSKTAPAALPANIGCGAQFSHFGGASYFGTRSIPIAFDAPPDRQNCNFDIPYDMPLANTDGNLSITIFLHGESDAPARSVNYNFGLPPIPMPADNAITTITETFNVP